MPEETKTLDWKCQLVDASAGAAPWGLAITTKYPFRPQHNPRDEKRRKTGKMTVEIETELTDVV